jgi:hypothetical protein
MGAVAALAGLLVLVEWLVVTDREQITEAVHAVAASAERGDVDAVLTFIWPSSESLRQKVRGAMLSRPRVVRVTHLKVDVRGQENPPHAKIDLVVMLSLPTGKGEFPVSVEAFLRKHDGKWLVYEARERLGI